MKVINEETTIALISKDISYIQVDIGEIKQSIKSLSWVFASKEELTVVAKETEIRLNKLEKTNGFLRFAIPIISAVFSSGVTFLLLEYLKGA